MPRRVDVAPAPGDTRTTPRLLVILAGVFLAGRLILAFVEKPPIEEEAADYAGGAENTELVLWVNPDSAEMLSVQGGKPILYDFGAAWCSPCKSMKEDLFKDPAAASFINSTFVPVQIVDRAVEDGFNSPLIEALEKRYMIRAFPTLVVAGRGGEPAILEGYTGKSETLNKLRAAAAKLAIH